MSARHSHSRFATRLSGEAARLARFTGLFLGLARLSLLALAATMTTACVIEDPPPYSQPKRTPPRLDLRTAAPVIDEVIVRSRGGKVPFNVRVASEDAGDDLVAFLLEDYMGGPISSQFVAQIAAGTLDDNPADREIVIEWTVRNDMDPGCHRLTLLVTHRSNFEFKSGGTVLDPSDVAMAVWWANIEPVPGQANMLQNCPVAAVREP